MLHHELGSTDPQRKGGRGSPVFPIPTTPPWFWALVLAPLQLQVGRTQLAKLAKREREKRKWEEEDLGWIVWWQQSVGSALLCSVAAPQREALQGCLSWWSCTWGSEKDLLLFPSWPHIHLDFPSYSPAVWILSSSVQLVSKAKIKPLVFFPLFPTSPGRSNNSFRRRQARETARGRVLGSCWKSGFGWEWVLTQAQQLFRNLWLQCYNNFINTCLGFCLLPPLCCTGAPPHLAIKQTGKPLSLFFVKSWTGSSRSQLNPCTSKEMGGILKKGEREVRTFVN